MDTSTHRQKFYKFTHIVDVGDGLRLWRNVASITSLNAWLVMCRASNNWAVPTLSNVKDCIRDMCTPKSRWMPLHSMHTIMPKFVDSHVASEKETIVIRQQNASARTGALAKLPLCYAETSATMLLRPANRRTFVSSDDRNILSAVKKSLNFSVW